MVCVPEGCTEPLASPKGITSVYVKNYRANTTVTQLRRIFIRFGAINDIQIICRLSELSYATVFFATAEAATAALAKPVFLGGDRLLVTPRTPKPADKTPSLTSNWQPLTAP
mmetsp:Transcript_66847/g.134758  ORF Transcript_66847/g.134758 Transcript_66847/m.134758 type:complete len:112 (-) Transcript_66847:275-610(-)